MVKIILLFLLKLMEMTNNPKLKVIILGESGVGKTALLTKYMTGRIQQHFENSINVDSMKKQINIDGTSVTMEVWDTAGQEKFRAVNSSVYRGTHCCILMYDVTFAWSYRTIAFWREECLNRVVPVDEKQFPFVLIGNKIDKEDREVLCEDAETWCKKRKNIPYFECSAMYNTNVHRAFETVSRLALMQYKLQQRSLNGIPPAITPVLEIEAPQKESKKKNGCKCSITF